MNDERLARASALLRELGIGARFEYPGHLFVDCADGATFGFSTEFNQTQTLEVYFYPDHQAANDLESYGGEDAPENVPLPPGYEAESIVMAIMTALLRRYAPKRPLFGEPGFADRDRCAQPDCGQLLCLADRCEAWACCVCKASLGI